MRLSFYNVTKRYRRQTRVLLDALFVVLKPLFCFEQLRKSGRVEVILKRAQVCVQVTGYVADDFAFKGLRNFRPMQLGPGVLSRVETRASCVLEASLDAVWAVVRFATCAYHAPCTASHYSHLQRCPCSCSICKNLQECQALQLFCVYICARNKVDCSLPSMPRVPANYYGCTSEIFTRAFSCKQGVGLSFMASRGRWTAPSIFDGGEKPLPQCKRRMGFQGVSRSGFTLQASGAFIIADETH